MARELRATRYLPRANPDLAEFIQTELRYLDFDGTLDFYMSTEKHFSDHDRALLNANDRYYLLTVTCKRYDALHPWLFERCREVEKSPDGHLDLWARYHYKAECLDTPTITPVGWRRHGDLDVGDEVFGPDGKPTRIVARTPVFTDVDCYRVTFDKGEQITVSGDHLWTVEVAHRARLPGGGRTKRSSVTIDTRTLARKVDHATLTESVVWPSVPVNAPLDFGAPSEFPLHPYLMGVWLGDGSREAAVIANHIDDDGIVRRIEELGYRTRRRSGFAVGVYGIRPALRASGVFRDKHIPDCYARAPIADRWELLRGLMDTDGHCDTRGTATFCNADERLARDMFDLAAGLGLKPSIRLCAGTYKDEPYPYWQVSFQVVDGEEPIFHLARKQLRASCAPRTRSCRHAIIKVERVEGVPVRCIQVARPDGLYLTGRHLVTTHNSTICTFAGCLQEIIVDPEITIAIMSGTNGVAQPFLVQLQQEMERNDDLKRIHSDVFWDEPRKQAPLWSRDKGLVVRRKGNPKEATIEAFGLIDGMRTGKHYALLNYDDLVDETMVNNPEIITKVTIAWELSDNLGQLSGTRKWHQGTRYCSIGSSRITMGDWSQRRIEDVRVGDTVIGWELKDGTRWLRRSKVVDRGVHFQQPVNTYTLETGRSVTTTADHKWWRGPWGSGAEYQPLALPRRREGRKNRICQPRGTQPKLRELLVPLERSDDREAAWLAGFFDGEGHVQKNKNHPSGVVCITQTMHNPGLIDETRRVLQSLGFEYREAWHSPSKVDDSQSNWADRCVFTINGGWLERYRFLTEVAPVRRDKLEATLFGQLSTNQVDLDKVEDAGLQDVHWLETETGNYVIEGFCSSNSFADTYGILIERKALKERRYPATEDGTLKGKPIMLTEKRWAEIKTAQRSTVNAQMLLNPIAGNESTFSTLQFRHYDVIPSILNIYIMVDPSKGKTKRSDRTAIAVIGIDVGGNKYLLDGYCHRMKLSRRWQLLKQLKKKWENHPGVQLVRVGYEQYGMQSDLEVIEENMEREGNSFDIEELNTPREGKHSKKDRIQRLEPDFNRMGFYLPAVAYHPEFGGGLGNQALWDVWTEADTKRMEDARDKDDKDAAPIPAVGTIVYRPMQGLTTQQRYCEATMQGYRMVTAIKRLDEDGNLYDLTRVCIEELRFHPFAPHDDLADAISRVYDMEPKKPVPFESLNAEMKAHPDS